VYETDLSELIESIRFVPVVPETPAPPTPSPTPASKWVTIASWEDEGELVTEMLEATQNEWRVEWLTHGSGTFGLSIYAEDGSTVVSMGWFQGGSQGTFYVDGPPGTYRFVIEATVPRWWVEVKERR
jgi:hypothetical protein